MSLDSLLQVQHLDTSLEQLRHRRDSLPERQLLSDLAAERATHDGRRTELAAERDGLARDQKRLEDEVALIEAKAEQEQGKLYGGSVTSPKEAQALQDEIESLKRHQGTLEDRVIELMEAIEPLAASIGELDATLAGIDDRQAQASGAVASHESEIDAEIAAAEQQRIASAAEAGDDLLGRYESVRAGFGPSTVVEFDGKNCVGCPLLMPAVELDRVKKAEPGTLVDCQECGRLVVR